MPGVPVNTGRVVPPPPPQHRMLLGRVATERLGLGHAWALGQHLRVAYTHYLFRDWVQLCLLLFRAY